jgi:hypothetical protein
MPTLEATFIKGDRKEKLDYRENLPVNMTAVARGVDGDDGYMLSHDGLTEFATVNDTSRGGTFNERFREHYRVSGNALEKINADGSTEFLGNVAGQDPVSFANSFSTQCIVSDGKAYLYDTVSLKQIVDPDLGSPIDATWFRGIYVFTDGEYLFHTDITDEFSISPLKYSSSEFASDSIKAVARNDQNQIIAFNRYSTEYFVFNASAPVGTSVLQVITGKAAKIGIVGTHCKAELDGIFFILGGRKDESPSIHGLNGSQEATIATREIDKILSGYTEAELSRTYMEARTVDRDKFIIVHLLRHTLLYNHSISKQYGPAQAWSFVKSGSESDEVWRAKYGVFDPRISKWIYGDTKEAKLAYLDAESAAQYDEHTESILYTPIMPLEAMSIDKFEINTIPGYSTSDFTSAFSLSRDGVTYGEEHWNKISVEGDYTTNYIARRLGYIPDSASMKFRFVSKDKMAMSRLRVHYG